MTDLSLRLVKNDNCHIARVAKALHRASGHKLTEQQITKILKEEEEETQKNPASMEQYTLEKELKSHLRKGTIALVLLVAIGTVWAGYWPLAGAVTVNGTFAVHSNVKKIQHRTGGTVKEILVHNGSKVKTGDVLARLDDTDTKAQAAALARQLDEVQIRLSRLIAERDGGNVVFPAKFLTEEHGKITKSELDFFKARQETQTGNKRLADSRIQQYEKQIKGLEAQLASNKRQLEINQKELDGMQMLYEKKYTSLHQISPVQREKARLEGAITQIESGIQETNNKINETKLQARQTVETFRADVLHDFNESSAKLGQLLEQYVIAIQALKRMDIITPVSGVINELNIHTVGGILSPAETLMTIVPGNDPLEIVARLPSDKIDQVKVGQPARIKMPAFERTTPDIHGSVNFVSPDLVESNKGAYYEVKVTINDQHPHGLNLTPGMPAEIFLDTEKRTLLSYMIKPLREQMLRMFIER